MKRDCSVPFIPPRIFLCANGCVRLQVGPAIALFTIAGLRELADAATEAVASLPPSTADDPGQSGSLN